MLNSFVTKSQSLLLALSAVLMAGRLQAQNAPPGAIFDLANTSQFKSGTPLTAYTQFTTSFVGDGKMEDISFAFRDTPAFFSFDDASITAGLSATNLLKNPGFEQGVTTGPPDVGKNVPDSWSHWIQPVVKNNIGTVAAGTSFFGAPHSGSQYWLDGSVEGFDGIYQAVQTAAGVTYHVSFWLTDTSFSPIQNPADDMLVYAGDSIPLLGNTIAPEPSAVFLMSFGIAGLMVVFCRNRLVR